MRCAHRTLSSVSYDGRPTAHVFLAVTDDDAGRGACHSFVVSGLPFD